VEEYSDVPRKELYELWVTQGWPITRVARHFAVSVGTIGNRARYYGIVKPRLYSSGYKSLPKDQLYDLFISKNLSIQSVAKKLNVTVWMAQEGLKYHGIKKETEAIVAGRKKTNKKRYGVEHVTQLPAIVSKARQTNVKRYGVEHVTQNAMIRERIRQTNMGRYGVPCTLQARHVVTKII